MLTHGSWVYAGTNATKLDIMRPDDRALLFLPLAHAFAWLVISGWLHAGCELALGGTFDRIASDAAEIRPTFVPGPPRVFEKVLAGAVASGGGQAGPRGWLFRVAMAAFERWSAAQDRGEPCRDPRVLLARGLVLPRAGRAVSHRLGGRIRLLLSGSAPLSPRVGRFFESIGIDLIEGYGMTETSAGSVVNRPGRPRHGTVGQPVPGTEVALAADGEVLIRSPGLMRGYWMDPEATAAALRDGWMHTGDVGTLDAEGTLRIVDRKKDLIITSGGKKVAPQRLERELESDPLVSHALVHGDRRPYLTAVLALDEEAVRRWASAAGLAPDEALADSGAVRARLQATVDAVNARLPRYATLKRFAVLHGDFTVLGGELTPTMKLRRAACERHLGPVLDALYRS
jgi:long-chain acyl-CoA synthetase